MRGDDTATETREIYLKLPAFVWPHKSKQVTRHFPHLDLFTAFGDPVATVVAINMLKRFVPLIANPAMHLHRPVSRVATQAIGAVVTHRDLVRQTLRDLRLGHLIHFPSGLED